MVEDPVAQLVPATEARPFNPRASQAGWLARTRATVSRTSAGQVEGHACDDRSSAGFVTSKLSRESFRALWLVVSMAMRAPLVDRMLGGLWRGLAGWPGYT